MVKLRVPPVDRRVKFSDRYLEQITVIKTDEGSLHRWVVGRRRRATGFRVCARDPRQFCEEIHAARQLRHHVQDELSLAEPARTLRLGLGSKIEVTEALQVKGRILGSSGMVGLV